MTCTIVCAANGRFLSAAPAPSNRVDLWTSDDASGRQRWKLVKADAKPAVLIQLAEPTRDTWVLTVGSEGTAIVAPVAPGNAKQLWIVQKDGSLRMGQQYLSLREWDGQLDLWTAVGPEGRQTWRIHPAPPMPTPAPPPAPDGKLLVIDPALKLPGWGASKKRTRISYDAKNQAIRIDYPAHPHASAGGTNWQFKPTSVKLPAREARVSGEVFFPSDFPFEASGSSAGKSFSGMKIGTGDASGGNWSRSGASFRLMWLGAEDWGSYACAYLYTEVSNPDDFKRTIDQRASVLDKAILTSGGMNLWRPEKTKTPCKFYKGKWNNCEMYMKLNTPGQYDGLVEMTINGVTQRVENFRWLINGSRNKIEEFLFTSWFGGSGSDPSWAPGRPCYSLTKNIRVWTA